MDGSKRESVPAVNSSGNLLFNSGITFGEMDKILHSVDHLFDNKLLLKINRKRKEKALIRLTFPEFLAVKRLVHPDETDLLARMKSI